MCALLSASVAWAATPAGTVIRNQASATYTDADGRVVTVTSNLVETTIEQVAGLQLTRDQSIRVVAGQRVAFSHRVSNTGNGDDRYVLQATNAGGDSIDLGNVLIYPDADGDGLADSDVPLTTTPWIAAGDEYSVVVVGTVPLSAVDGDSAQIVTTASSQFEVSLVATNTDTTTVGAGGAVQVTKAFSPAGGLSPSGPHTVTLHYENVGSAAVGDVTLIDALPAGMSYVPGSGRWSEFSTPLTDADPLDVHAGVGASLQYCAYDASCVGLEEADADTDTVSTNQVTAVVDLLAAGASGTLTFEVSIDALLPAGRLSNRAEFVYDIPVGTVPRAFTNTARFDVRPSAGVVANGSTATAIDFVNEPLSLATAPQGGTVSFDNIIWNTGNRTDTFDILVDGASSTFPGGTIWRLFNANGVTPLLDTDGNGSPDTGPIAPGEFALVVLSVSLPPDVAGDNGGIGFDLTKIARSALNANVTNPVTDHLDEIVANSVDLTNQAPAGSSGALGVGPGPEPSPVSTVSPDAGGVARYDLYIRHQGAPTDRYRLEAYGSATGGALPSGWRVQFVDPLTGAALTDTGTLASGASRHVVAEVSVPDGLPPGTTSLFFEAVSLLSGARDIKHDAVTIAEVATLRLEPGLAAQVAPGGFVHYTHRLTNTGQATVAGVEFSLAHSRPGWSATVYADTDGSGDFGAGDQPVSAAWTLGPSETRTLFVRVNAPAAAPLAERNVTTVEARWNAGANEASVVDVSTVSLSLVSIRKEQAVDTGCDGLPDPGTDFGPGRIEVAPGNNCVIYRLTATNAGLESSWNVKILDDTPAFTVYRPSASCSRSPCWLTEPASGETGRVSAETAQLLPGDSFSLEFSVLLP